LRALWAARPLPRQGAFDLMPTIFSGVGAGDALNENASDATGQDDFMAKKTRTVDAALREERWMELNSRKAESLSCDVVVVGAGIAGLYAAYRVRRLGLSFVGIEAGDAVGGTWYWNRYPGCRCDVPSYLYSYSFDTNLQKDWTWPEIMSAQPDIEKYLNHVADRHDLRPHFRLNTRVSAATLDETGNAWLIETDRGDRYTAQWCIMATGALSAPNYPDIPGRQSFAGTVMHTGRWPQNGLEVLRGKRVAVIGTGSSGVQSIPHIAQVASELVVFQRTAHYSLPAKVRSTSPEFDAYVKANYSDIRQRSLDGAAANDPEIMRLIRSQDGDDADEGVAGALAAIVMVRRSPEAAARAKRMFEERVRRRVKDPVTAEALIPKDYPIGCKRMIIEIDYFETYNRDEVTLVDLRKGGITEITPTSIRTEQGEFEFDALVFATGYDALTGALTRIDLRGRDGRSLGAKWDEGARAYLGVMTADFPNMFLIMGPGSPSVLSNMVTSAEQHVDWVTEAISYMRAHDVATIEASADAEDAWAETVNQVAEGTVYTHPDCQSWYLGANIAGKARIFLPYVGGVPTYAGICQEVAANGYEGFVFTLGAPADQWT
jgi:cyclohexanone monooxygenase